MSTEIEKRETDPAAEVTPEEAGTEAGAALNDDVRDDADVLDQDVLDEDAEADDDETVADEVGTRPAGVGQGAAAVVSAGLGIVALTGSWVGTIASARTSLIGQLETSQTASVATQVKEVYGDAWHATALVGGVFALLALVVGALVLARPAFGAPGRVQAPWIKSVAWGGVALGVLGLLIAVAKYTDLFMGLPSTT